MRLLKQKYGFKKLIKFWKKEISSHKLTYLLLFVILALGFYVRVYRAGDLMGFYYDQGRDALAIWKLWHEGRPFLIGPVTGLAGIFLGPFYYYLIAPFYLIGGGNPVYPAVFLAFLTICGVFMLYYLGWKFQNRFTGIIAAVIGSFSYYLVLAGRWLANPTPIMLTSMLFLYSLWTITKNKGKYWWIIASLLIGVSLQFESASAVFYIPVMLVFALWQRKKLPSINTVIYACLAFFATLVPQIIFNYRHENILIKNFFSEIFKKNSFKISIWEVFEERLSYVWTVFYSKILPERKGLALFFSIPVFYTIFTSTKRIKDEVKLLLIFIIVPIIGYFSFQGNYGNIYDYYMTGYYFPLVLLFSIGIGLLRKNKLGKIVVISFIFIFFLINIQMLSNYFKPDFQKENQINLGNEIEAVDWILNDAKKRGEYNLSVYVPPVIPYSYDYLFLWRGSILCEDEICGYVKESERKLVYFLFEKDNNYPWRLENWLNINRILGELDKEIVFDGITIQRRWRK